MCPRKVSSSSGRSMNIVIVISREVRRHVFDDPGKFQQALMNGRGLSCQLRDGHLQLQAIGELDVRRQDDGSFYNFSGKGHNVPLVVGRHSVFTLQLSEWPERFWLPGSMQSATPGSLAQSPFALRQLAKRPERGSVLIRSAERGSVTRSSFVRPNAPGGTFDL